MPGRLNGSGRRCPEDYDRHPFLEEWLYGGGKPDGTLRGDRRIDNEPVAHLMRWIGQWNGRCDLYGIRYAHLRMGLLRIDEVLATYDVDPHSCKRLLQVCEGRPRRADRLANRWKSVPSTNRSISPPLLPAATNSV